MKKTKKVEIKKDFDKIIENEFSKIKENNATLKVMNQELEEKLHKETEKRKLETSKVKDCKVTQKLFREEIAKLKKDKKVLERLLDISLNEGEQIEETTVFTPKTELDEVIEANYIFSPEKSFFEKAKEKLNKIWYGK